jgi:hypothetical protein
MKTTLYIMTGYAFLTSWLLIAAHVTAEPDAENLAVGIGLTFCETTEDNNMNQFLTCGPHDWDHGLCNKHLKRWHAMLPDPKAKICLHIGGKVDCMPIVRMRDKCPEKS